MLPLLFGCSSEPRVLNIEVVTGHEADAMTQDPPVARVIVEGTSPDGTRIQAEAPPGGDLDFGDVDGSLAYTFEVTGLDGSGATVMRGRSLGGIVLDGIASDTFQVFAQRLRAWARAPGTLARAHTRAPAVSVGERYLYQTGGDAPEGAPESEVYDLFAWSGATGETLPFAAHSMWSDVTAVLVLGSEEDGEAAWLDENGLSSTPPVLPDGLTGFGEIAGGSAVFAPDGRVFLVGATRAGTPTDAVVEIAADANATTTVRRLLVKRAGAAATWLADVGLVVAGGSADGAGVEVLAEEATTFSPRDFPSDPTVGAGAVRSSFNTVLLIGGTADGAPVKTRLIDPRCTKDCVPEEMDALTPEPALTRVTAYFVAAGKPLIVVGDEPDPSGLTRMFLIDDLKPTVTEIPLREPRRGATPVPAPNGTLALMGGVHPDGTPALTVEMYFPE